jgi:hypothetical protein
MIRLRPSLAVALLLFMPSVARASWASDGNLVVGVSSEPVAPMVVAGAAGNVYLAWVDARSGYNTDIRASLWTAAGVAAGGWTRDGDMVTNKVCYKYDPCAVTDAGGGVLYAWSDQRCVGYQQIYACRVVPAGATAAGWTPNGVRVAATTSDQLTPAIAGDGAGGAFVAWQDLRGADADLYLQHVDGTGAVVAGWPAAGLGVAIVTGLQSAPVLAGDGAGGVFVAWQDHRAGNNDIYLQHVTGAGTLAPGWPANGMAACGAPGDQRRPTMVADDEGGVLLAWQDHRAADWDIYALHVQGNAALAPGWSADGVVVSPASGDQIAVRSARDGNHGLLLAWQDHRGPDWDVYAIRLATNASVASGWPAGGRAVTASPGDQTVPDLAGDETGGLFVAWQDRQLGTADIRATHLAPDGSLVAGWPAGGALVSGAPGDQTAPRTTVSGADAYVIWTDERDGAPALYAQRLLSGGPIPVRPVGLAALHHDGQTFLTWTPPPDTGWTYRIYVRNLPIATDADLAFSGLLGSVGDSSATDRRLSTILGTLYTFRPDSAAALLAPNQGLFVVTVPSNRRSWYAVTAQLSGGPEDRHIVPGGNALASSVEEVLSPPRPVYQRQIIQGAQPSDVYTLWTWSLDTPLFPAMSNRSGWPYDCGVTHGSIGGPGYVCPHRRAGDFTQTLVFTGVPPDWVLGLDDYTLNSDVQTYWYGYHPEYDFSTESNVPPLSGTVIDYTNRRVLYTIRWWRRTFALDTTRVYAGGYSLGGTYSMRLGLEHPELVVAVMSASGKVDFSFESDPDPLSAFNPGQPFRQSLTNLWGTTTTNLPTSEGSPVYAEMNDDSLAAFAARGGAAFLVNFAGRHDFTVGWAEKRGFYSAMETNRQGGIQYWDNRDHGGATYPGALAPMFDLHYLYRFRSNLSWPAFSRCSTDGNPGDFTATTGDSVGTLNGYLDWDPALVDSSLQWQVVLRTRGLSTLWGPLPAPESLKVDVTPRRVQRFKPAPGLAVTWTATRLADGAKVQSGTVNVDALGLVTVPAVRVDRTGTRLELHLPSTILLAPPIDGSPRGLSFAPFPNPVRDRVALAVSWPHAGPVRVVLYDTFGRCVRTLWRGDVSRGPWGATADLSGLAPGVYTVRAEQEGTGVARRLVLLR